MRWQGRRRSGNVIDARGRRGPSLGGSSNSAGLIGLLLSGFLRSRGRRGGRRGGRGGGGGRGGAIGCGTLLILALVAMLLLGIDPLALIQGGTGAFVESPTTESTTGAPPQDEAGEFVAVVLAETEDTWHALFEQAGRTYREPELVLFDGTIRSACGISGSATGPFYCPADDRVYLDLSFFRQLEQLGATGEFAVAYVIAHEVGHHIQNQLGVLNETRARQRRMSQTEANALQVRVELQADCFAGVWAHHADRGGLLSPGDLQNGLDAAAAVGSDHIARQSGRPVQPESFTHGTSEQRMRWFRTGFDAGTPDACDTLA